MFSPPSVRLGIRFSRGVLITAPFVLAGALAGGLLEFVAGVSNGLVCSLLASATLGLWVASRDELLPHPIGRIRRLASQVENLQLKILLLATILALVIEAGILLHQAGVGFT